MRLRESTSAIYTVAMVKTPTIGSNAIANSGILSEKIKKNGDISAITKKYGAEISENDFKNSFHLRLFLNSRILPTHKINKIFPGINAM